MIFPDNYEKKIGFDEIRQMLNDNCLCTLGKECIGNMSFMTDSQTINQRLAEIKEYRQIEDSEEEFPMQFFFDVRQAIARLRLQGTHMEEEELFNLGRTLNSIREIRLFLAPKDPGGDSYSPKIRDGVEENQAKATYPALWKLAEDIPTFPDLIRRIMGVLDRFGHIKDSASSALFHLRHELRRAEGTVSQTLHSILRSAQADGLIDKDVTPTLRDGRLVLPVSPSLKRRIPGIVHDESATGRTVFIEPSAVVEANNRIRELEAEERREVIRILTEISDELRPWADAMLQSLTLLAAIDSIQAKARFAKATGGIELRVEAKPRIDWRGAIHPLLQMNLQAQGKKVVPLDIELNPQNNGQTILIISGPNAGGKSVCLKTVGLLQYMLQCGLSVPMTERSNVGIFNNILIDIGDEQSIEDDLSTYSSHLRNMKMMIRYAEHNSLLLIDEFGTGTEPQIGGAIAEAVLKQFWQKKAWGVITTHYQNLKHFADSHDGIMNGAMLYDRHKMQALFQLQTGRPGSSFAIEIARKTGLPEEVIADASDIVGQDYIQSDKYLQDIVRDKRYWEQKRQNVHQREKEIEKTITRYENSVEEIERERKAILSRAKAEAKELLAEANRRIENTIREIREAEAAKEATKRIREDLETFRGEVEEIDTKATDEAIAKKMQQILARRERKEKRKQEKKDKGANQTSASANIADGSSAQRDESLSFKIQSVEVGATVRIKGTKSIGVIESIQGKNAVIVIGDLKTRMPLDKLEASDDKPTSSASQNRPTVITRTVIDEHKGAFRHEIDVRGMRGDEALLEVQRFVDDAILVGANQVRILHGKGNGILRQLIRQYLQAIPNVVSCRDEHVQFGGAGITVVEL